LPIILWALVFCCLALFILGVVAKNIIVVPNHGNMPSGSTTTPEIVITSTTTTATTTATTGTGGKTETPPKQTESGSTGGKGTTDPVTSPPTVEKPPVVTPAQPPVTNPTPTPTPTPTPAPVSTLGEGFGISFAGTLLPLSDAEVNARLADAASLGVKWIRIDVGWNDIQRRDQNTFNWSGIDRIVASANAHGLHVLGLLTNTPGWARIPDCGSTQCGPDDSAFDAFANFAAAAATRYAPQGVHAWEIWNEPNIVLFWQPQPDVRAYTNLLKATYPAIKRADPNSIVISGGLSPAANTDSSITPYDFLARMYSDGAGGSFDAVGMHPYSYPATPALLETWNAWSQMASISKSLRSLMQANGDSGKQIWMTEYGAPTGGPGSLATMDNYRTIGSANHVTEDLQAEMLRQAITLTPTYPWAGPLFWYSYKDMGTDTDTNENFFGLVRFDGSHKPAYDLLSTLLHS
jgi:hypothetical protein